MYLSSRILVFVSLEPFSLCVSICLHHEYCMLLVYICWDCWWFMVDLWSCGLFNAALLFFWRALYSSMISCCRSLGLRWMGFVNGASRCIADAELHQYRKNWIEDKSVVTFGTLFVLCFCLCWCSTHYISVVEDWTCHLKKGSESVLLVVSTWHL